MKMQEKLPLSLEIVAADLKDIGLDATVIRSKVDYDSRAVGTNVLLTLVIRIDDLYGERDNEESAYDRAMEVFE